jgi:hypothetical protein
MLFTLNHDTSVDKFVVNRGMTGYVSKGRHFIILQITYRHKLTLRPYKWQY